MIDLNDPLNKSFFEKLKATMTCPVCGGRLTTAGTGFIDVQTPSWWFECPRCYWGWGPLPTEVSLK